MGGPFTLRPCFETRILVTNSTVWAVTGPLYAGRASMAEQWERTVPCTDVLGRLRDLRVYLVEDGNGVRIGFHVPAGEVAELQPQSMGQLHDVIAAARLEATRRGAVWG